MRRRMRIAAMVLAAGLTTASALAAERMFVPLGDGNAIVVIDIAEDKVIDRIDGVSAAHGLAGTPDGRFLIAGSSRTRAPGTTPVKPAGVAEEDHAAHHAPGQPGNAGTVSVSTVTIIRQSDLKVERQIDVPGAVHHVAASPDGRLAVVTHPARNGITVIDLVGLEARPLVATGPGANYAAFSNNGALVYVSNGGNDTVTALNTKTWKVAQTFTVGREPEHLAMAPNGRHLYVNNVKSGTISVINLIDPRRTRQYRVGANPHGVDVSDDSDWSYVAVQDDNKLVGINRKKQPQRSVALAPEPYHLAVVRGRGKIYISSAKEPKIWVVDVATLTILREIPIGGKGHQMVQGARS